MESPVGPPQQAPGASLAGIAWSSRTERLALVGLALFALALRVGAIPFQVMVTWDGCYYVNHFRDASWQWVFPPGYPFAIAAVRLLTGDGVLAAQLVSAFAGALLTLPLYRLARTFLTQPAALVAAAVTVLNPLLLRYGALAMSESLYVLLLVTAFWLLVSDRPFLFGLAAGAAYLVRPEALLVASAAIAAAFAWKRAVRPALAAVAGLLLVVLPYITSLRSETGEWTLSPKTMNLRTLDVDWKANVSREREHAPAEESLYAMTIAPYPGRFLAHAENLVTMAGIPLLVLSAAGMARRPGILLAGLSAFFALPFFGLTALGRLAIPYIPFLAIFAAIALEQIPKRPAVYLGGLVCLLGVAPVYPDVIAVDDNMLELKAAGLALRPDTRPTDIVLDRKPYTAFYAGGQYLLVPDAPPDTVIAFARRAHARFLVLGERTVATLRPQLAPLLYASDSTAAAHGLVTRYRDALHTGTGVRILEIRP